MIISCRNIAGDNWALVLNTLLVGEASPPCESIADKFNSFKLKSGLCASKENFLAKKIALLATFHSFFLLFSPDRAGRRIQVYLDSYYEGVLTSP